MLKITCVARMVSKSGRLTQMKSKVMCKGIQSEYFPPKGTMFNTPSEKSSPKGETSPQKGVRSSPKVMMS
jgi:hypothetical protein